MLDLAEHDAEEQMSPRRLGESAPRSAQPGELRARGVKRVTERGRGPAHDVLGERDGRASNSRMQRHSLAQRPVQSAEQGSVGEMDRGADDTPTRAARERLPEQLDVVEAEAKDALVKRLLGRPDRRCERAGEAAAQRADPRLWHQRTVTGPARAGISHMAIGEFTPPRLAPAEPSTYRSRALERGVSLPVYLIVRGILQPFFHVYFRMRRLGREHIPRSGAVIFAANHRSFLDPFVIGTLTRRPVYYVAKKELFAHPVVGWLLNRLGAFPIDRGAGDHEAMETARRILERGDCVVIFPEGTRTRPGPLGPPRRGVGRLALQTGAPVVPVAVLGTEAVRRDWRIRPHRVTLRCGRPLSFPQIENPTPAQAAAVCDRIWPCVAVQWDWLGGEMPERAVLPARVGTQPLSVA